MSWSQHTSKKTQLMFSFLHDFFVVIVIRPYLDLNIFTVEKKLTMFTYFLNLVFSLDVISILRHTIFFNDRGEVKISKTVYDTFMTGGNTVYKLDQNTIMCRNFISART